MLYVRSILQASVLSVVFSMLLPRAPGTDQL